MDLTLSSRKMLNLLLKLLYNMFVDHEDQDSDTHGNPRRICVYLISICWRWGGSPFLANKKDGFYLKFIIKLTFKVQLIFLTVHT